ncbi:MAG: hypothetical protein V1770_06775 [bacterium]
MKKKFVIFSLIGIFLVSIFADGKFAMALNNSNATDEYTIDGYNAQKILEKGIKGNYKPIDGQEEITSSNAEIQFYAVIGRWIEFALSLVGIILIVLIIYAGYLWFAADGNEEQVSTAKSYIINAVIGITIVFLAYAITYYVLGKISGTIRKL